MRAKIAAILVTGAFAAVGLSAPVQAQSKTRVVAPPGSATQYIERDEQGRTRAKVIVQRRSFLDPGPELPPGVAKFTDYVYPPGYSPTSEIDNTLRGGIRTPLPGPFDLPGKDNPYPWTPY